MVLSLTLFTSVTSCCHFLATRTATPPPPPYPPTRSIYTRPSLLPLHPSIYSLAGNRSLNPSCLPYPQPPPPCLSRSPHSQFPLSTSLPPCRSHDRAASWHHGRRWSQYPTYRPCRPGAHRHTRPSHYCRCATGGGFSYSSATSSVSGAGFYGPDAHPDAQPTQWCWQG